jgi:DNA polymerase III psi subunit
MLLVARQSDIDGAGGYTLLSKILAAIKYDIDADCLLVALPDGNDVYALAPLLRAHQITDVIAFGVNPKHLNMHIMARLYSPMQFEDYVFLLSHKVTEMDGNRDFKMKLWKQLQALYLK